MGKEISNAKLPNAKEVPNRNTHCARSELQLVHWRFLAFEHWRLGFSPTIESV
jgi:hypothetical protein